MAGSTTIGKLNVVISGQAEGFEKAISNAEKRLTGFAKKATLPIASFAGGFLGASGIISSPLAVVTGALDTVTKGINEVVSQFSGGKLGAARLGLDSYFNPEKFEEAGKKGLETMRTLTRESKKFDISPAFLRASEHLLGPDAEAAPGILHKVIQAQGKIRSDPAFARSLAPFFDDVSKLAGMKPEEYILNISDAMGKLNDQTDKMSLLEKFTGARKAATAMPIFESSVKIKEAMGKVSKGGQFTPGEVGLFGLSKDWEKEIKLAHEELEAGRALQLVAERFNEQRYQKGQVGFLDFKGHALDIRGSIDYAKYYLKTFGPKPEQPKAAKPFDPLIESAHELRIKLEEEAAALNKVSDETLLAQLRAKGLTKEYNALKKSIDDLTAAQGMDFIKQQNKMLDEAGQTPLEQMQKRMRKAGKPELADQMQANDLTQRAMDLMAEKTPFQKIQKEIKDLGDIATRVRPEDIGRKMKQIMAGTGFEAMTIGGNAPLATQGSQEEAALIDRIRQETMTAEYQNSPQAMAEYLKTMAEEEVNQTRAAVNLGLQFRQLAEALKPVENDPDGAGGNFVPPG